LAGARLHCLATQYRELVAGTINLAEVRADHWAAQQVDPLLLAESLLLVSDTSLMPSASFVPPARLLKKPFGSA